MVAIGIDLGTTYSCVGWWKDNRCEIIANDQGNRTTPSYVAFTDKERIIGDGAKNQSSMNPENTVFDAKRLIGRDFNDITLQSDLKHFPFEVKDKGNKPVIEVEYKNEKKQFHPEEISSMILTKMKETAEAYIGEAVTDAVVTVPAYFNDSQRKATKQAAEIAGLEVERIINEPTAAALAYGLDKEDIDETIAVFDFGGGTFDVTVLEISDGVFEVKATNGHTKLGGADIDDLVADWIADKFYAEHKIDLRKDKTAWARVLEAAEKSKKDLSSVPSSQINLPYLHEGLHLKATLPRSEFEKISDVVMKRLVRPCENAMKDAGVSSSDIDKVILVGGSTRIPKVQDLCKKIFGKAPERSVNPDEVVASGAAIQGGVLQGDVKDVLLLDVTPLSLGIETLGGVFTRLIDKNTTIPTKKSQVFSTAEDNQSAVTIRVFQGEREMAADNKLLGQFDLVGIPPAARGMPQIEVTFDIDANGIVNVSAKDKSTGKEQQIRIQASGGLSDDEIERMVKEAEENAEEDKKKRESVDTKNHADSLINETEKNLKEHGDKVPEEDKNKINTDIEELKKVKDGDDIEAIKSKTEALVQSSLKLGEAIYKQNPQAGAAQPDPSGEEPSSDKKDEKVVDAEFEEVDENKKD